MKHLRKHRKIIGIALILIAAGILAAVALRFQRKPEATEAPVVPPTSGTTVIDPNVFEYIEIVDSCGPYHEGACVSIRSGPGATFEKVGTLRTGIVLRVDSTVEKDGHTWYKIKFDDWLRYPERITTDWYVSGDFVREFKTDGVENLAAGQKVHTQKLIIVSIEKQMLYAYDGDTLYLKTPISTGSEPTPTGAGTFTIFKKTPTRYMQGPIPDVTDQAYDLPGVPWNQYFNADGAVIHGAYWHNNFGRPASHGCINVPLEIAEQLYFWTDIGMRVVIVK